MLMKHPLREEPTLIDSDVRQNDEKFDKLYQHLTFTPATYVDTLPVLAKAGFTLAEVLITLGIIGVVAALTIPSLINKYQDKVVTTALKRNYSILSQAVLSAVDEYGTPDNWMQSDENKSSYSQSSAKNVANILSMFIKNIDKCTDSECISKFTNGHKIYNIKRNSRASMFQDKYAYLTLTDGTIYEISSLGQCNSYWELRNVCASVRVDVNGLSKPNALGWDVFTFFLTSEGRFVPSEYNSDYCNSSSDSYVNGQRCTKWVLTYGNREYLRCDGLTMNGKIRCK